MDGPTSIERTLGDPTHSALQRNGWEDEIQERIQSSCFTPSRPRPPVRSPRRFHKE